MKADVESVGSCGRDKIWHRLFRKTPGLFWWAFLVSLLRPKPVMANDRFFSKRDKHRTKDCVFPRSAR